MIILAILNIILIITTYILFNWTFYLKLVSSYLIFKILKLNNKI